MLLLLHAHAPHAPNASQVLIMLLCMLLMNFLSQAHANSKLLMHLMHLWSSCSSMMLQLRLLVLCAPHECSLSLSCLLLMTHALHHALVPHALMLHIFFLIFPS